MTLYQNFEQGAGICRETIPGVESVWKDVKAGRTWDKSTSASWNQEPWAEGQKRSPEKAWSCRLSAFQFLPSFFWWLKLTWPSQPSQNITLNIYPHKWKKKKILCFGNSDLGYITSDKKIHGPLNSLLISLSPWNSIQFCSSLFLYIFIFYGLIQMIIHIL